MSQNVQARIDTNSLNQQVESLSKRVMATLNRKRQTIQRQIAGIMERLILDAFDQKSSGSRGSDGIVWSPDSPETVAAKGSSQIGIRSGAMRESLRVTVGAGGSENGVAAPDVVAAFTAPYAEYFDRDRKLLPDSLPDAWAAAIEGPVEKWAELAIKSEVDRTQ